MKLDTYLEAANHDYDPTAQLVRAKFSGAGYHSRLTSGTLVHPLRESMTYAAYLLASGEAKNHERAAHVLRAVLSYQDRDPASRTFGIWPYTAEESLAEMNPPDWNWADFLGSLIGLILASHADSLDEPLVEQLRHALRNAAMAIFRRNTRPEYTNIAIMGAGVTLMAGELLPDPFLLAYGRRRLERIRISVEENGDFAEYNSPTYTFIALEELSRILFAVTDSETRATATYLADHAWAVIADRFHPPTGQLAGPHSRAYSERLALRTVRLIEHATGARIHYADAGALETGRKMPGPMPELVPMVPCPQSLRHRFAAQASGSPAENRVVRNPVIRGIHSGKDMVATTWLGERATLGSVSADSSWVQRHPLIGYWREDEAIATTFLVHVMKDGREFASFMVRTAQQGNRAVIGLSPLANSGDWHLYLDHPPDHQFTFSDLRVSFVVSSPQQPTVRGDGSSFLLAADGCAVRVTPVGGAFQGDPVRWETESDPQRAALHAILYRGDPLTLDFRTLEKTWLVAAIDLVTAGVERDHSDSEIQVEQRGSDAMVRWQRGIELAVPTSVELYPLDPSIWKQG